MKVHLIDVQVTWVKSPPDGGQPVWKGPLQPDQKPPVVILSALQFDTVVGSNFLSIASLADCFFLVHIMEELGHVQKVVLLLNLWSGRGGGLYLRWPQ